MPDHLESAFWNAVKFIVLCPYKAHQNHSFYKSPGNGREKTRTVRIDCPRKVPIQQLATAAHFTWDHATFRVGEVAEDLLADPDNPTQSWEDENYSDLYVFVPISNSGRYPDAMKERREKAHPKSRKKRRKSRKVVSSSKDENKLTPHYFSSIFHIMKNGDIRAIRYGEDLPGVELKGIPGKKGKRKIISAAFIREWLSSYESSNYS